MQVKLAQQELDQAIKGGSLKGALPPSGAIIFKPMRLRSNISANMIGPLQGANLISNRARWVHSKQAYLRPEARRAAGKQANKRADEHR